MQRTVYVRPEDAEAWEWLAKAAQKDGVSLSTLLARVIRRYKRQREAGKP